MKIVIVSSEESKWKPEQIQKAKEEIEHILAFPICPNCFGTRIDFEMASMNREIKDIYHCMECGKEFSWEQNDNILVLDHLKGGVGILTEEIANQLGIKTEIRKPEDMAKSGDIGYCIVPFHKNTYCPHHPQMGDSGLNHQKNGGCWTVNEMKRLGKETNLVVIK